MQMRNSFIVLATCLAVAGLARAEDKYDPAARAVKIAPFLDEQAVAVVYVDLARFAPDPIFAAVERWFPETKGETAAARQDVTRPLEALRRAGAREVFVVVSLADLPQHKPLLVLPLSGEGDEKAVDDSAKSLDPSFKTERRGDVLLVGEAEVLTRVRDSKPDPRPDLVRALEAAGDTAFQAVLLPPAYGRRVVEEMMPTLPSTLPSPIGGLPITVITRGVQWAALGVDWPPHLSGRLNVQSADAQAAAALKSKWDDIVRAMKAADVAKVVPKFDELIKLLTPEVHGDRLVLTVDESKVSASVELLGPAMQSARANAMRVASINSLKQISLAMLTYEAARKTLPPAASYDAKGNPLLSWRVHVLPYLGEEALYKQFHLDEPWDSAHNRTLIDKMPGVYRLPDSAAAQKGLTHYLAPVGKGAIFSSAGQGTKPSEIKEPSRAILVVESDRAVIWSKPDDLAFDPQKPVAGLKTDGFSAAFADGHVEFLSKRNKLNEQELRSMLGPLP